MIERFFENNRKFWSRFPSRTDGGKLLIAEPRNASIAHRNALYAVLLNQARGYRPVWLDDGKGYSVDLLRSYFPEAETVKSWNYSFWTKLAGVILAFRAFLLLTLTGKIIGPRGVHYDGVYYGDIVYDIYLGLNEVATIKRIRGNLRLWKMITFVVVRHREIRRILARGGFAGVLVDHQVGFEGGAMLRTALRYGYLGFLSDGINQLQCLSSPEEVYGYPHGPKPADVDLIVQRLGDKIPVIFSELLENQVKGRSNLNGIDAFSRSHQFYNDRAKFNADFRLDPSKKNIFIMLHGFVDHPHAMFRWMLFKDYFEWFRQTLNFARRHPEVNWVFKQHPYAKYYKTKDVVVADFFRQTLPHIVFIDDDQQIDTRSLISCADLVVTCLGSAGFELPAMGGIPSLTAGDNFYTGLGFAMEPKTERDYFEILSRGGQIQKLSPELQRRAQAAYLHIYLFSHTAWSALPELVVKEFRDSNMDSWYWDRVSQAYKDKEADIIAEFNSCVNKVKQPGFKRFNRLEEYCREHNL